MKITPRATRRIKGPKVFFANVSNMSVPPERACRAHQAIRKSGRELSASAERAEIRVQIDDLGVGQRIEQTGGHERYRSRPAARHLFAQTDRDGRTGLQDQA